MKDYYYILGIGQNATADQIKSAYRKLSIKFHPDKNDGDKFFEERFKEIQEAFDTLSHVESKINYDYNLNSKYRDYTKYNNSYEDKLRKDFDQELKRRRKEFEDVLNKKEKEHAEEIRKAQEETKKKYQTEEQRDAEEAEKKRKKEEYERLQDYNRRVRDLESLKTSLKEKETTLSSLNRTITVKQHEISKIKNEIKYKQDLLNNNKISYKNVINVLFIILFITGILVFIGYYLYIKNNATSPNKKGTVNTLQSTTENENPSARVQLSALVSAQFNGSPEPRFY